MTIILEEIDISSGRAVLRELSGPTTASSDDVDVVNELLRKAGLSPVASLADCGIEKARVLLPCHSWRISDDCVTYEASFPHRSDMSPAMGQYISAVLATSGIQSSRILRELRLAIYELCTNVFDHGTPLHSGAELVLGLSLESAAVHGWIQDECARFDPLAFESMDLDDRLRTRNRRGYGIQMARRSLDVLRHEFNERGNRLVFRKELKP